MSPTSSSSSANHNTEASIPWEKVLTSASTPEFVNGSGISDAESSSSISVVVSRDVTPPEAEQQRKLHHQFPYHDHLTFRDVQVLAVMSLSGIASFAWLVSASGPGAWRYYLAGSVCAAASHAIPVPIDVVKTRKQVDPLLADKHFLDATKYIVKHEGVRALLAGLGPTTLGYLLEGAMKFGVYEVLKPLVRRMLVVAAATTPALAMIDSQSLAFVICGAASGVAASIILCPMEALRIRLVANPNYARTWVEGGIKMLKNEGVSALMKGLIPMLCKQVPYTITKNVSFDLVTKNAYAMLRSQGLELTSAIKLTVPLLSAALASVLSCVSSQPGDMLLSLVNAHEGDRRRTHDVVRDIMRSDRGVRGFFVGLKTRFLHVGVIVTLQLIIYDLVKRFVGIAATGSD